MSLLEIKEYPDPVLKKPARKLKPGDVENLPELISDMIETMDAAPGVGLAAPQIGKSIRLFIAKIETEDGEFEDRVFINPTVLESDGFDLGEEGCLSFPGLWGMVERPLRVRLRFQNENFEQLEEEFEGFSARVVLHENDHLDGILINDRTSELYEKVEEEEEEGEGDWNDAGIKDE